MGDSQEFQKRLEVYRRFGKFLKESYGENPKGPILIAYNDPSGYRIICFLNEDGRLSGEDGWRVFNEKDELIEGVKFDEIGFSTARFSPETGWEKVSRSKLT